MRAAASEREQIVTAGAGGRRKQAQRWVLLTSTLAFNAFATCYYVAVAVVRNPVVLAVGLALLWAVWAASLIITLTVRPATRVDRLVDSVAPVCLVISVGLYFLV